MLVPDPGFVAHKSGALISEGELVSISLHEKNGLCPSPSDVTSLLTPKSRVMFLSSARAIIYNGAKHAWIAAFPGMWERSARATVSRLKHG